MAKSQAQEFKLLETHGEMKDGSEKKTEHLPNGKICQEKNVKHILGLTVHVSGVIQKYT